MKTLATSLALAGTLVFSSLASADIVRSDLRFDTATQPTLELVRGGGADRPDPFAELREQQSQKDKAQKEDAGIGSKDQMSKSKDKSGGGFFGLFGS